jgi:predicted Zn-dependent protease with MMP-like domain
VQEGFVLMDGKQIIMNFTVAPSLDEMETLAKSVMDAFPDELLLHCESMAIVMEEFPDEVVEQELELDDPYDLLGLFRSGREISPGVERKTANDDDVLLLFRRPILDLWCESGDDLASVLRQVMIEEVGKGFEFSEDDIDEMNARHYQGML